MYGNGPFLTNEDLPRALDYGKSILLILHDHRNFLYSGLVKLALASIH